MNGNRETKSNRRKREAMADCQSSTPESQQPTFEACLCKLQEVVRSLEEGTLPLDASIAAFERGIFLLRRCYQSLEQAEQKIELLTGFDRAGNPIVTAFDAAATPDGPQSRAGRRKKRSVDSKDALQSGPQPPPPEDEESNRLF
jgi:exodeoxyribonuclease VII small subunit